LKTEIHALREPRACQSRLGTVTMANVYDVVRYPNWPVPETHPATLGAFGALFGRSFAPFHACRVLEIGCGEGVNLMSMAVGAPASEFVGIDVAEAPVARGSSVAQASMGRAASMIRMKNSARRARFSSAKSNSRRRPILSRKL
jgi:tRNA G46 methylase TrmB